MSDEGRYFNYGEASYMAQVCPRPRTTPAKKVRFPERKDKSNNETAYKLGKEEP